VKVKTEAWRQANRDSWEMFDRPSCFGARISRAFWVIAHVARYTPEAVGAREWPELPSGRG
jgi:hypothetical protein